MQEQVIPLLFLFSTIIIFLVSEFLVPSSISGYIQYAYLIVLIASQVTIYTFIAKNACEDGIGFSNVYQVILPWIIIPSLLFSLLKVFPGWKAPFSNTVGWGVAKLYGMMAGIQFENLIDNSVYRDNNTFNKDTIISLFFNHYSIDHLPDNASNVVERIFKIKDIVARYIWYLLIGLYSLSVSNFQLSRVRC